MLQLPCLSIGRKAGSEPANRGSSPRAATSLRSTMAISQVNVSSPAGETIFQDSAMGASADGIKSSSAKVYSVTIDNSANAAPSYVKLYNLASGSVTVGTTAPDEIIYVPSNAVVTQVYFTGAAQGKTFGTGLSAACVTTGGTAGSTPPSSSVIVSVTYV